MSPRRDQRGPGGGCRRAWWLLLLAAAWLWTSAAQAHEFRPAALHLTAAADGEVQVRFVPPPVTARGPTSEHLRPIPPPHCRVVDRSRWSCGPAGLTGELTMEGLAHDPVVVVVVVRWWDGEERRDRMGPDRPSVSLGRGTATTGPAATVATYLGLGGEHILGGFDHLLFLATLLLLGGRARDHLRTITAFTVGHALTLVAQSLHPVAVPGPWVEACIAASVVIAAAEALRPRPAAPGAPSRAWTWALAFGLLHGLGFAGALAELGLPASHGLWALLGFNLGVEAGQLAVVLVLLTFAAVGPRLPERRETWRRRLAFVAGSVAVAWTLERVMSLWSPT